MGEDRNYDMLIAHLIEVSSWRPQRWPGSQLHDIQDQRGDDQRWQPPSAEGAEDRNNAGNPHLYAQVGVWRSPCAVAGDRNEADTLIINHGTEKGGDGRPRWAKSPTRMCYQ